MNEPTRRDALRELAEQPTANFRVSTLVRQRLNDIEAAQANGHSNAQIVEAINKEFGVSIKLKTFEQALWRIRNAQVSKTQRKAKSLRPATSQSEPADTPTPHQPLTADTHENGDASPEINAIREALNHQHRENKLQQYAKPQKKLGVKQ
ncbi:hypothetical protein [Burkholderia ubonensis]|uniref:hypothetical protein n=1 Tax=Burkholderia ubonensis TaxID=101571 RepID=UPI0011604BCD|nr:hypothetical protein [Burkholderia ubonensis]